MRKNRMLQDGAEYHVTARINRGELVFVPNEDKQLFLNVCKQAKKRFNFQMKNFCIMNNHIHFLIKPGEGESLSKIMQWLLSVFAMRWNKQHHQTGHLWGERFFSRIVAGIVDFLRVFMYIDENPVQAGLVVHPWLWEYGGLWYHRKGIKGFIEELDAISAIYFPEHRFCDE